ncbi:aminotransferase class V-fold PLP-dependent enzyme [bacterium]|nr:aminotransferase class V-fold PLP-dependent enzyme [bacterium]
MSEIHLFTPGPTHVPERVLAAMHRSELHHRTAEFRKVFQETQELLQEAVNASDAPIFLACSGTGALEALVANGVGDRENGDVLGYLSAGKFGARWGAIGEALRKETRALEREWGESPSIEEVRSFLHRHPEITHFAVQYCETSTAVLHDIPRISELLREEFPEVLFFIDAISAATTVPLSLQELHWDGIVLASQKAFMLPPGLSMLFLSERFWNARASLAPRTLYFDLTRERDAQEKGNGAWTPASSLILGLREALHLFSEEGWSEVSDRHAACRDEALRRITALGFSLVPAVARSSAYGAPGVSGALLDDTFPDAEQLRAELFSETKIRIAGGQDHWKGQLLRFGHMGVVHPADLTRCFDHLEQVLALHHPQKPAEA